MSKNELLNEIKRFKKKLNNSEEENYKLSNEIRDLKYENEKLNKKVIELKKVIETSKNISNNNLGNTNIIENNYLNEIIKMKDKEIKLLEMQLKNNTKEKLVDINKILVINFISSDGQINCGLKCLETDTFAEIEEQLYQQYDKFRNTNNNFLVGGNLILRFKTIRENKIKNNDKIMLIPIV